MIGVRPTTPTRRHTMVKVECGKCMGKGHITAFSHVQGGVCFSCGGTGYHLRKSTPKPSKKYSFSFLWTDPSDPNYQEGDYCLCFWKKARSLKEAESKAKKYMHINGSVAFKVAEA
jgi:hypothetical protein